MDTAWEDSTCEYCKFQKSGRCRKNPPTLTYVTYLSRTEYPKVRFGEFLEVQDFMPACSQYSDSRKD